MLTVEQTERDFAYCGSVSHVKLEHVRAVRGTRQKIVERPRARIQIEISVAGPKIRSKTEGGTTRVDELEFTLRHR